MTLALVFRGNAFFTTGYAFARALEHLQVPFAHINNNAAWADPNLLRRFDAALVIDDGFGLGPSPLPNLPNNSAYYAIDTHVAPEVYLPYLHQFQRVYAAQYTLGYCLLQSAGFGHVQWLPLAWDSLGIPYVKCERDIPIAFIASWTTEQRVLLRDVVHYKYGGMTDECYHKELGEAFSRAKLGLNVLGGRGHIVRYNHTNLRMFDLLGCGALLLQQDLYNPFDKTRMDDVERLGLIGAEGWWRNVSPTGVHFWDRKPLRGDENYVSWRDSTQLFQTIAYFSDSANEAERAEIAARGQKWAQENTFIHRTEYILKDMGL